MPARVVEAGAAEVELPSSPPTKAVEVRVTTERTPEVVLLEMPPGAEVGMVWPAEVGALEAGAEVSEAVVSVAAVEAGPVVVLPASVVESVVEAAEVSLEGAVVEA